MAGRLILDRAFDGVATAIARDGNILADITEVGIASRARPMIVAPWVAAMVFDRFFGHWVPFGG